MSRPTVREALIALEVEDVVDVRTGSSIYVVQPGSRSGQVQAPAAYDPAEWGLLELMRARELVEGEVAALAARNAKKAQVGGIAAALAQMQDPAGEGIAPRAGDQAFHTAVAQACGNEVLRDTVHGYWRVRSGPLLERLGDHFENPASWKAALVKHAAVLQAHRAHDPGAVRSAMQSRHRVRPRGSDRRRSERAGGPLLGELHPASGRHPVRRKSQSGEGRQAAGLHVCELFAQSSTEEKLVATGETLLTVVKGSNEA